MEFNKTKDLEYQIPCLNCRVNTFHGVLFSVRKDTEEWYAAYQEDYELVICRGCRQVSFRSNSTCSESMYTDQETGEDFLIDHIKLYPPRISGRKKLENYLQLPHGICEIYDEIHTALCNDLFILSGIGMGALIESVCTDLDASGEKIKDKIVDLVNKGLLTKNKVDVLRNIIDLRNDAAHRTKPLSRGESEDALNIIEHLLSDVYIIPKTATKLLRKKKVIP